MKQDTIDTIYSKRTKKEELIGKLSLIHISDDKLDLLAVSLPPGRGKTTLAIFYLTWLGGKLPNEPMLTGSHSNSFVRGVYDELSLIHIFSAECERGIRDPLTSEQEVKELYGLHKRVLLAAAPYDFDLSLIHI